MLPYIDIEFKLYIIIMFLILKNRSLNTKKWYFLDDQKWGSQILENEAENAVSNQSHYTVQLTRRVLFHH